MLSTDGLSLNDLLMWFAIIDEPVQFISKGTWFWGIVTAADIWKEMGWNAIIFLAAIAGVDPQLYEAARVDEIGRASCRERAKMREVGVGSEEPKNGQT